MIGQCFALRGREHIADVTHQLNQALGGLIGQLQVFHARGLERAAIESRLRQRIHHVLMRGVSLRLEGQEIIDGLFHERGDLSLLGFGGIDLDVEVLEHVIDVGIHFSRAMRAVHHRSVMPAAHGEALSGDTDGGGGGGTRHEREDGGAVEEKVAERPLAGVDGIGSSHGQSL